MTIKINKKDMVHVGGTIFNYELDAPYIKDVINENDEKLKFCYNINSKILSVLDFKKEFSELTITTFDEDLHNAQ